MIKRIALVQNIGRGFKRYTFFTKYIAENGNAVCTVDAEIVTSSEGNDIYRKLKSSGATVSDRETTNENDAEIVEYIGSCIDEYVEYIDNGKQYFEAKSRNDKIYKILEEFKRISQKGEI